MVDLQALLKRRILVLDGGMGTSLQGFGLRPKDYGGEKYEGCNEILSLTRPDAIMSVHEGYLKAGADIIETNTFAGSSITLAEYGLEDKDYELNKKAAELAKNAVRKYSTPSWPRFVAGAIGPTNKTLSISEDCSFEQLRESYYRQAKALIHGGADILLVETIFDTLNAKAAMAAIRKLFSKERRSLPIMISATVEKNGTMLAGQDIEAFFIAMQHYKPLAIGMNCGMGPDLLMEHLRTLSRIADTYVLCYPNAGLPREDGTFPQTPQVFAEHIAGFIDKRWVNIIGGCCGTTKEHISSLHRLDLGKKRGVPSLHRCAFSGLEPLVIEEENRPIIIGERTNVIGSRRFKRLIEKEKFELAAEIGCSQAGKGAQILDVCLSNPDRNEVRDAEIFFRLITKKVRMPLMIDATEPNVIEAGLKQCQGKCIINSLNFEEGTERIARVMPLIKEYGAGIIFGTIDEDRDQALAITSTKKLEIAKRAYIYLTQHWGIAPHDIIFDPLVFPVATGDKQYAGSARVTIEAIKKIKGALPRAKTILGISNLSFGLPEAGREVLNTVFLFHATKAGLDFAIVNPEKLRRYSSLKTEELRFAESLLFNRGNDPVTPFVAYYRGKRSYSESLEKKTLEERLQAYVIEGRKDGLIKDLNHAMQEKTALEIIKGPLMQAMSQVGKLFNDNKLIVPEVLQSAEAMKAAVMHLEQFMEKGALASRGKIVLATVKGDVHDIGKNLFCIIASNNGYEVIDLGIRVSPGKLIEACRQHQPDIIGLSGLLVKSALMMEATADDLKRAGISTPMLVGGAALSEQFTKEHIQKNYSGPAAYAKDAMAGLALANTIMYGKAGPGAKLKPGIPKAKKGERERVTKGSAFMGSPWPAPDLMPHIIKEYDVRELFRHINPAMLYGRHLGLKGSYKKLLAQGDEKAEKITLQVEEVKEDIIRDRLFRPKAIYQFFECSSMGDEILIFARDKVIERLQFPRQKKWDRLCAADFVAPPSRGRDSIGIFVTTCGEGVMEMARARRHKGEYLGSHILQVLALECAEAFAEIVHKLMREQWGINDASLDREQIFKAEYQGIRLSYGYPACPDLGEQKKLFRLLHPEQIGVRLTESCMMDPEASVSALVFHHPKARYFDA